MIRLPPSQIPIKRQTILLNIKWGRYLSHSRPRHRMPQIDRTADLMMHLQIPRHERKRAHVLPGPPGCRIRFARIDGVLSSIYERLLKQCFLGVRDRHGFGEIVGGGGRWSWGVVGIGPSGGIRERDVELVGHFLELSVDTIGERVWAGDGAFEGFLEGAEASFAFCGQLVGRLGEDVFGLVEELGKDVLALFWCWGIG